MARAIGTLGTIDSITVGGRVITDLTATNLIMLTGAFDNGSTNSTLRKPFQSSGYVVPALKTFRIVAIQASATGGVFIGVGYADNDVGQSTGTAYTNPVSISGAAGIGSLDGAVLVIPTTTSYLATYGVSVPTGKYVAAAYAGGAAGTVGITVYGYEE